MFNLNYARRAGWLPTSTLTMFINVGNYPEHTHLQF